MPALPLPPWLPEARLHRLSTDGAVCQAPSHSKQTARKPQPSKLSSQLTLHSFICFTRGFVKGGDEEVAEHFDVSALDHVGLYLEVDQFFQSVHGDADDAAAGAGFNFHRLHVVLKLLLHLLGLLHHLADVQSAW